MSKKTWPDWLKRPTGVANRADWPKVALHINWRSRKGKLERSKTDEKQDLSSLSRTARKAKFKDMVKKAVQLRERKLAGKRGFIAEERPTGRDVPRFNVILDWTEANRATQPSAMSAAKRLDDELGHLRVNDIKRADLEAAVVSWYKDGVAANTILYYLSLMSAWFNDEGVLYDAVKPLLKYGFRKKYITDRLPDTNDTPYLRAATDIVDTIHAMPNQRDRTMVATGTFAGLRPNEVLGLRPDDVDLSKRLLRVARQKVNRAQATGPTKSRRVRWCPITDDLYPILRDWLTVLSGPRPKKHTGQWPTRHLFTKRNGEMVSYSMFYERSKKLPVTLTQAMRHTFSSHWVATGKGRDTLQAALGHRSYKTTERYAHLDPQRFDDLTGHVGDLLYKEEANVLPMRKVNKSITKRSQNRKRKVSRKRKAQ